MISALSGELRRVEDDRIHVQVGPLLMELLVPAVDSGELQASVGREITFHTILYLQGDASGGNAEPRLIGFLRQQDKRFFEKFITVKGIGPRTALRALTVPVGEIAQAIESKDARFLVQLDGIGKRTAELIVAELSGKVAAFMTGPVREVARSARLTPDDEQAVAFLSNPQMGLRRADAERLLQRVRRRAVTPHDFGISRGHATVARIIELN